MVAPVAGVKNVYYEHLQQLGGTAAEPLTALTGGYITTDYQENKFGHRSGIINSTLPGGTVQVYDPMETAGDVSVTVSAYTPTGQSAYSGLSDSRSDTPSTPYQVTNLPLTGNFTRVDGNTE